MVTTLNDGDLSDVALDAPRQQSLIAFGQTNSEAPPWKSLHDCGVDNTSLLFVDDDPSILDWLKRKYEVSHRVFTACSGEEGLGILKDHGPFAVVVSDQRMPGISGVQFLLQVRTHAPESVRVILTGFNDLDAAVEAINRGEVFRFLMKPLQAGLFDQALASCIEQHRLLTSQQVLLSRTLHGSIKVLVDLLAMTSPEVFGHAGRVKDLSSRLAKFLKCEPIWQIEIAAMLCFIGLLALPEETVAKVLAMQPLFGFEREGYEQYPQHSLKLLSHIPRLESVANVIRFHNFGTSGDGAERDDIPLGSRIIKVASDYHLLLSLGRTREAALDWLADSQRHSAAVVEALQAIIPRAAPRHVAVLLADLQPGMVIADDLRLMNGGALLLAKGHQLTDVLIHRLMHFQKTRSIEPEVTIVIS